LVDGDKSLVVADKTFVEMAERNMNNGSKNNNDKKNILPLYYEMKKARSVELNPESIYKGLNAAYTGGNIGYYSNAISKIWNFVDWENASEKDKRKALDTIKVLCMENNFCIDMAKTLYTIARPDNINDNVNVYTKHKLPHFFKYAKNKHEDKKDDKKSQVERNCGSLVDRLEKAIVSRQLKFDNSKYGLFNYRKLMSEKPLPSSTAQKKIIDAYNKINKNYHFKINQKNMENVSAIMSDIKKQFVEMQYSDDDICNTLVQHLFKKKTPHKELLWQCFGEMILKNIKTNIPSDKKICFHCGKKYTPIKSDQKYCKKCSGYQEIETKIIKCVDCGCEVEIEPSSRRIRCAECYIENEKKKKREWKRKNKNIKEK